MSAYETALKQRDLDILDTLTEATRKMTEGELIQLTSSGIRASLKSSISTSSAKTGYLFSAACRIGGDSERRLGTRSRALLSMGSILVSHFSW